MGACSLGILVQRCFGIPGCLEVLFEVLFGGLLSEVLVCRYPGLCWCISFISPCWLQRESITIGHISTFSRELKQLPYATLSTPETTLDASTLACQ